MRLSSLKCGFAALTLAFATTAVVTAPAFAEATISVFGGANFSPHSSVDYSLSDGRKGSVTPAWDGASFELPPYYGVRATWWLEEMPNVGVALEFTHAKVKADPIPDPFTRLEFTDGINFLTANALYRWKLNNGLTPYVGAGAGLAIPHVEVEAPGIESTAEYQITGAAVQAFVGVSYEFAEDWSVFGEFKSSYGVVDADLKGGGSLKTDIISNQAIIGLTYRFY